MATFNVLSLESDKAVLLDQTKLPARLAYSDVPTWQAMVTAIETMIVRGAPAIGVAGAFGFVLAAREALQSTLDWSEFRQACLKASAALRSSRPTAVNLMWALDQMNARLTEFEAEGLSQEAAVRRFEELAQQIHDDDVMANKRMGNAGVPLFPKGARILTHCNAGALATAGYGTALGVIRSVFANDPSIHVYVDETRPRLQGATLTAWELMNDGIPCTLISDNMAGWLMQQRAIDAVVVGADRIAANGDTANKIGTYSVAVLAQAHQIPFYVAAPFSTIDFQTSTGALIPIEERASREVTHVGSACTAPKGVSVYNPAFDVTPAHYVSAFVTEKGLVYPPFRSALKALATQS